jgi:hypothetical protein
MSKDVTYYIDEGYLYKSVENDGPTYLKYGPEIDITRLCTIDEAVEKYPEQLKRAFRSMGKIDGIH